MPRLELVEKWETCFMNFVPFFQSKISHFLNFLPTLDTLGIGELEMHINSNKKYHERNKDV